MNNMDLVQERPLNLITHSLTWSHYNDVIMGAMASQITSITIVYLGANKRKHQSFASLAFVWGINRSPVNSPHIWPVMRKMFPFDDIIMLSLTLVCCWKWGFLEANVAGIFCFHLEIIFSRIFILKTMNMKSCDNRTWAGLCLEVTTRDMYWGSIILLCIVSGLIHWPQGNFNKILILKVMITWWDIFCEIVGLPSEKCHWTLLMISQHCFR